MKFLLALILCLSCSTQAQFLEPLVDNELVPYKQDFSLLIGETRHSYRLDKVTLLFANLNKDAKKGSKRTLGECSGMYSDITEIKIDIEYWKEASMLSKRFTVFHELGHCICTQGHSEIRDGFWESLYDRIRFVLGINVRKGYLPDNCPASIMHPYEFSEWCMYKNFEYYMDDLKKSCQ